MKKKKIAKNCPFLIKKRKKLKKAYVKDENMLMFFSSKEALEKYQPLHKKIKRKIQEKKIKKEKEKDKPIITANTERYEIDVKTGLTTEQVNKRIADGLTNNSKIKTSKTFTAIFLKNIFTFFNMLWLVIAIALLSVGSYGDLIFVFVIIANTAIAIIQEIKAKIAVEKLSIVTSPLIKTIRNGQTIEISAEDLVLDDVIYLGNGNHIPADCIILDGKVEVNESLLTGESNSIDKNNGDQLLSGSFIVSGECYARVDKIGKDNYVYQIAKKAKEFKAPQSNLFKDLNSFIKYIGIAIIPIGVLTFLKEFTQPGTVIKDWVSHTSGAITGMIPAGMYLLVTISLAVGVIKLSKKKTLVRDLYSVEMLARTNVLCLDKTGTITDGTMKVVDFMTYGKRHKNTIQKLLSNVLNNQRTLNATSNALVKEFGINSELKAVNSVEFSSERKYSITQFSNNKIYFMGAVTRVGCPLTSEQKAFIKEQQDKGLRIIAFSEMSGDKIDKKTRGTNSTLLAFIVLEEHIREDAIETIAWFKDNGVDIKIISGDDPATVSKIAQRVGVANSDKFISLETFSLKEVEQMADDFTVFGRVTPEQKYTIIKALKNKGKVVAMTGDGVNDTLALKEADCSIAMADGSEVARSISNLVLLESNFSSLPAVVKEGRQAVNNVQNSASLFLMKTFFAVVLVILTLFVQVTYIFTPKMMLLLEFFVIGVPSFFLTFEPNSKPIVGNFLPQVLKRSIPRAMLMLFNVIVVIVLYYSHAFNPESALLSSQEYITLVVLVLTYTGFLNLATLCIPPTLVKGFAVSISLAGITASVFTVPRLFNITMVSKNVLIIFFSIIAFSIILLTLLKLNKRRIDRLRDKVINLLQKEQ